MKNLIGCLCLSSLGFLLFSCTETTPQEYFEVAVLNSNQLNGFAGNGPYHELESSSVKLVEGQTEPVPMTRKEMVASKIAFCDEMLAKLEALKLTEDTKSMVETSKSLYVYVKGVYQKDYTELARLYDGAAPATEIQKFADGIHEKCYPGFDKIYAELIRIGKIYAEKHNITVNWG